jgi:Tol biopolymer transport system component
MIGHDGFTLTVYGADFVASSVVRWNGSDCSTTYVDGGTLRAAIPASDVAAAGTASITAFNPPPGGGVSGDLAFSVLPVGQIAFDAWRTGDGEIYVMNADGSDQVNLTNSPAWDIFPVWSPDGSKLAFTSTRDGNFEVYVMNADGTGQVNLTNSPGSDGTPAWSPDGSQIAFRSARDGNGEIYLVNADGTGQVNLTNSPGSDGNAAWSPDGSQIAFGSDRDGNGEIYVMNADGTGQVNLTNSASHDGGPSLSARPETAMARSIW